MEPKPGTMVTPKVRLARPLGAGGMGSVWVADHLALEVEVAVKLISAEALQRDPGLAERFKREAAVAAKIKSPHVVQMHDHGLTDDGTPYIVMELLAGESLRERLERCERLSPRETGLMLAQVAEVLSTAHAMGVVHRDLKPDNVFLVCSGYEIFVKVLDFGIAKHQGPAAGRPLTRTDAVMGTPEYMSPEQLLSAKAVDHRADLWALGVVVYEALTGWRPFHGETQAQTGHDRGAAARDAGQDRAGLDHPDQERLPGAQLRERAPAAGQAARGPQ
ncbi:MAG: serine/threonine protein kinase, partial [Deltaproteobacteria bacterium]|nr:serine/threonine protein kinase [Deltaproteobacteria bacterium]